MYLVAITRWGSPLEGEVGALAELLGLLPYDAKLRLGGPLPVIFAREPDAARARALLAALRGRGHGAVACDLASVQSSAEMICPRSYAFEPEALRVVDPARGERRLPYGELLALIQASAADTQERTTVHKSKQLSLGRAVLSGGLVMRQTKTTSSRQTREDRELVVYLIRRSGRDPMLLRERSLRHRGLGQRVKPTGAENLATLVAMLRQRAPQALFDARLARRPRKSSLAAIAGSAAERVTSRSNAGDNDLAAHLIAVAHLLGQQ